MAEWQQPSRAFVREFLQLYESLPALWRLSSPDYKDRTAKTLAYDAMVRKLREVLPTATADCVRRRINILRTNFRKEMKKCLEAERRGQSYTPKLWYYTDLLFLRDQGALRDIHEDVLPMVRCVDQKMLLGMAPTDYPPSPTQSALSYVPLPPPANVKCEVESPPSPRTSTDDQAEDQEVDDEEEDIVARHVAAKLRRLHPLQRIFAEKLIHDVLFEGQLGSLTRAARVVVDSSQ